MNFSIFGRFHSTRVLVVLYAVLWTCFATGPDNSWSNASFIGSDGFGYYAYLPAIFIDGDLAHLSTSVHGYAVETDGHRVIKYTYGVSLLLLPFFGLACLVAWLTGFPVDGFSLPFQYAVAVAALVYLILGLLFVKRMLVYWKVESRVIALTLLLILFATPLLYYSMFNSAMSHPYSFFAIAGFVYFLKRQEVQPESGNVFLIALFFGLLVIIRPFNGILFILLIPFLMPGNLRRPGPGIISGILIFLLLMVIQVVLWYWQSRQFFYSGYQREGFYFGHPELFRTLFGFRKGLFIYTPVLLLIIPGFWLLFQKFPSKFLIYLAAVLLFYYLNASWYNWFFSSGYGQRSYVDILPLLAIPMSLAIQAVFQKRWKWLPFSLIVFVVGLNLIQTYQYAWGIMSSANMDWDKYKYIFLKTDAGYRNVLGGRRDVMPYHRGEVQPVFVTHQNFEARAERWEIPDCEHSHHCQDSESGSTFDFSGREFGPVFRISLPSLQKEDERLYLEVSVRLREFAEQDLNALLVIVEFSPSVGNVGYSAFKINEIPTRQECIWKTCTASSVVPEVSREDAVLSVYLWNVEKQAFEIDDFDLTIYSIPN